MLNFLFLASWRLQTATLAAGARPGPRRGDDTSPSVRAARLPRRPCALTRARAVICVMTRRWAGRRAVARGAAEPQGAELRGPEPGPDLLPQRCHSGARADHSTIEAAGNGHIGAVLTMPDAADWHCHYSQLNASLCSAPTTMGMNALRLPWWCSSAPAQTDAADIPGM